jgi:hypothetical protein
VIPSPSEFVIYLVSYKVHQLIFRVRHFNRVLGIVTNATFHRSQMKLPTAACPTPLAILSNPKLSPFFDAAHGAVDGSLVAALPPEEIRARFRDRKGGVTWNIMGAVDFDQTWVYMCTGWEGSASDGHVWNALRERHEFPVPSGCYFLADGGYPNCDDLLVPFRQVRYHLREYMASALG